MATRRKILIIENHDDFGGHAKRNEFTVDGHPMLIGYGGSEAMEAPRANFSETVARLMDTLGVNIDRFDTAFDTKLYAGLGLSFGVFFDRENFGTDRLLAGSPLSVGADPTPGNTAKTKPIPEFIGEFPMSPDAIKRLTDFFATPKDYLAGKSDDDKIAYLQSTSYRDYLKADAGLGEEAVKYFEGLTLDYFAVGIDAVSAYDAMDSGYPGFGGLVVPPEEAEASEPYIYHFPDGNASIARLLVRSLIPDVGDRARRWTISFWRISTIPSSISPASRSASASAAPPSASTMRPTARARSTSAMSRPTRCIASRPSNACSPATT